MNMGQAESRSIPSLDRSLTEQEEKRLEAFPVEEIESRRENKKMAPGQHTTKYIGQTEAKSNRPIKPAGLKERRPIEKPANELLSPKGEIVCPVISCDINRVPANQSALLCPIARACCCDNKVNMIQCRHSIELTQMQREATGCKIEDCPCAQQEVKTQCFQLKNEPKFAGLNDGCIYRARDHASENLVNRCKLEMGTQEINKRAKLKLKSMNTNVCNKPNLNINQADKLPVRRKHLKNSQGSAKASATRQNVLFPAADVKQTSARLSLKPSPLLSLRASPSSLATADDLPLSLKLDNFNSTSEVMTKIKPNAAETNARCNVPACDRRQQPGDVSLIESNCCSLISASNLSVDTKDATAQSKGYNGVTDKRGVSLNYNELEQKQSELVKVEKVAAYCGNGTRGEINSSEQKSERELKLEDKCELTREFRVREEPQGREGKDEFVCVNIKQTSEKISETEKNEARNSSASVIVDVAKKHQREQKEAQENQQQKQEQANCGLADNLEKRGNHLDFANKQANHNYLAWSELAAKYGRMTRKGQRLVPTSDINQQHVTSSGGRCEDGPSIDNQFHQQARSLGTGKLKESCFCHLFCALIQTIFPIFSALKNYSLPGDLLTDFAAGFTVAVLHIPQGMAYGLLSGVEPIYGLYVSFIPVLVMSLMSKSRHASYGTFAIISMLLVNTIQQTRSVLQEEQTRMFSVGSGLSNGSVKFSESGYDGDSSQQLPHLMVLKNNHKASDGSQQDEQKDYILKSLIGQATEIADFELAGQNYLIDSSTLASDSQQQFTIPMKPGAANFIMPTNIEILTCVCIVCGIVHVTMALMRLGVLSLMFSDQLISSFTTAGAIHVLTSQLAGLFDLNLPSIHGELFKCMRIWWQFTRSLVYDELNQTTAILSFASIVFLLVVKELIEPRLRKRFRRFTCLPSELVLMSVVIGCSSYFNLESDHKVKIVGLVPSGLPQPKAPRMELVPYVLKDSISIALITFAMNLSIAQVYAKKFRYELDANQELFALGSANIISSFFSCFPCASSLSRSSVQSNLNVRSQLCSLFSCCIVVLIICYFAHILHDLPKSTLSCIIVVALKGILMQLRDIYDNWRLSKLDALVWVSTFLSVIIFGVTFGLILGIIASIFMIFLRLLTPNHSVLARLPGTEIFIDKDAFADCEEVKNVKIFRFNSALCYLNRTMLKAKIEKLLPSVFEPRGFRAICSQLHLRRDPFYDSPENEANRINYLVIDCSALSYCDYSGATTLVELIEDLDARKVTVYLAACPLKLISMLEKIQTQKDVLGQNVFPSISDALGQINYLCHEIPLATTGTTNDKGAS